MKENQSICLTGTNVVLVPYRDYHVPQYHAWMSDPEIREATGSEPLTLSEEYEMQKRWAVDQDKCTFIILSKCRPIDQSPGISSMIGDVNLFLFTEEDDSNTVVGRRFAEIEIMIAEADFRGRGLGKESVALMMQYGFAKLELNKFSVKINEENEASQKMFQNFGFREESYSKVFRQHTMGLVVDDIYAKKLESLYPYQISEYKE
uniref:N-acetyltransferase domain-containing protein n=1 Tax=Romanomermis culicivorax TaxID=13658 RepID=A0A915K343_ROMCU